ncbi:hypothetical protein [Draconibacterium orientale]|uniref:hypothetical protein n=1 Tax=Draconibacterium orientale TaxID=1168034 RepID=UPI0029C02517|nr:hypothetical protein [Draconibacterium orientale]
MLQLFLFYSRLIFTSFGENGNLLPHAPACNNDTPIPEDFSCKKRAYGTGHLNPVFNLAMQHL